MANGLGLEAFMRGAMGGAVGGQQQMLGAVQALTAQRLAERRRQEDAMRQQDLVTQQQDFQREMAGTREANDAKRHAENQQLEAAKAGLTRAPIMQRSEGARRIVETPQAVREHPMAPIMGMVPGVTGGAFLGMELQKAYEDPTNQQALREHGQSYDSLRGAAWGKEVGHEWKRDPSLPQPGAGKGKEPKPPWTAGHVKDYRSQVDILKPQYPSDMESLMAQVNNAALPPEERLKAEAQYNQRRLEYDQALGQYNSAVDARMRQLMEQDIALGVAEAPYIKQALAAMDGNPQAVTESGLPQYADGRVPDQALNGGGPTMGYEALDDAALAAEEARLMAGPGPGSDLAQRGPQYPTQYLTDMAMRMPQPEAPTAEPHAPAPAAGPGPNERAIQPVVDMANSWKRDYKEPAPPPAPPSSPSDGPPPGNKGLWVAGLSDLIDGMNKDAATPPAGPVGMGDLKEVESRPPLPPTTDDLVEHYRKSNGMPPGRGNTMGKLFQVGSSPAAAATTPGKPLDRPDLLAAADSVPFVAPGGRVFSLDRAAAQGLETAMSVLSPEDQQTLGSIMASGQRAATDGDQDMLEALTGASPGDSQGGLYARQQRGDRRGLHGHVGAVPAPGKLPAHGHVVGTGADINTQPLAPSDADRSEGIIGGLERLPPDVRMRIEAALEGAGWVRRFHDGHWEYVGL